MIFPLKEFCTALLPSTEKGQAVFMHPWQLQESNLSMSVLPVLHWAQHFSFSRHTGKMSHSHPSTPLLCCPVWTPRLFALLFLSYRRAVLSVSAQIQPANVVISVDEFFQTELVALSLNCSPVFPFWEVSREHRISSEKVKVFLKGCSWTGREYIDERWLFPSVYKKFRSGWHLNPAVVSLPGTEGSGGRVRAEHALTSSHRLLHHLPHTRELRTSS